MGISRWLKTWGALLALLIAVIALGVSVYAVYIDSVHYQETIKPHTQHDEIYNRLVRLDDKIERVQQWSNDMPDIEQGISELQLNVRKAIELRDQAELAWDEGHYTEADKLISEAHDILEEMLLPIRPLKLPLIGGIIAAAVVVIVLFIFCKRRAGEVSN